METRDGHFKGLFLFNVYYMQVAHNLVPQDCFPWNAGLRRSVQGHGVCRHPGSLRAM